MFFCVDLTGGVFSLLGFVQEYCRGFSHKGDQLMYHCKIVCSKNGRFGNQETEISIADCLRYQASAPWRLSMMTKSVRFSLISALMMGTAELSPTFISPERKVIPFFLPRFTTPNGCCSSWSAPPFGRYTCTVHRNDKSHQRPRGSFQ